MPLISPLLLLFLGAVLVTRDVLSEFQPQRMPSSHRQFASKILSRCRSVSDRLTNETTLCAAQVRRLAQSTRCRELNIHLEMAEARLDRLDEYVMLRQLESLQLMGTDCQDTSFEVELLEAQKRDVQENVDELTRFLQNEEARNREVVKETDALREEQKALDCELDSLETERRMLEKQLELQTAALGQLSAQKDIGADLASAMRAAAAEQERALDLCRQRTSEHQSRLAACREQVDMVKTQLEAMQEPTPEVRADLERRLAACREEADSCHNTTSSCAAELETASDALLRSEMASLAERGRLQGCQRELIASRGRFDQCRDSGRQLIGRIRGLQREASSGPMSAGRLNQCYSDSSICGSRAATCAQELSEIRSSEEQCDSETSLWYARWKRCNDSVVGLEHDQLAPRQRAAKELEVQVNETVAAGYQCEDDSLRVRADRGFAEEDLLRAKTTLRGIKRQLAECQMGCSAGAGPETEGKDAAGSDMTDDYGMSW